MCWLMAVAVVVVLAAVEQPHLLQRLHLGVEAAVVVEELNFGFLLLPLALLKQSLWALVVQEALLERQTILAGLEGLLEVIQCLDLGQLQEALTAVMEALRHQDQQAQAVVG